MMRVELPEGSSRLIAVEASTPSIVVSPLFEMLKVPLPNDKLSLSSAFKSCALVIGVVNAAPVVGS